VASATAPPDRHRRCRRCRHRRCYHAATAVATTAATAGSAPRRTNSRRRRLFWWRRWLFWWRRCRDRPGWCPDLRRLRRWCRNLRRVRRGDLSRGNRSDQRGEHRAMRVTVRPVIPVAARPENDAAHQVRRPHHSAARRFLPRRRHVDHVQCRRRLPQIASRVDRVVRLRGDTVHRLIRSRRGISHDGSYLALIPRAVGLHCRSDESGDGGRDSAGGELGVARGCERILPHVVHLSGVWL